MPNVNPEIYNKLIQSQNNNEIIIPTYKGQQGNPILFSKSVKDILVNVKGDMGAKKILEKNKEKVFYFEINNQAILKNYNTLDSFYN